MKKIILIIASIFILNACTSEEMTYKDHLNKAEKALAEIERIIEEGNELTLIPSAYAEVGDDQAIVDKANEATEEIGNAQDKVDDMAASNEQEAAQSEVNETKEQAEETLAEAASHMDDPESQDELGDIQNELGNITPEPHQDANAAANDPSNMPDDDSMRADSNDEGIDNDRGADSNNEEAAAEQAVEGDDDEEEDDSEANYDAFKEATGVDFKPIYEDTDEQILDTDVENTISDKADDLQERTGITTPGAYTPPGIEDTAVEEAMRELMQ